MPKESLILNNFSGGINSHSSPRDIESNKSSTESRIEGYDEKGGQLSSLYNAEIDRAGVIRVSGGANDEKVYSNLGISGLRRFIKNASIFSASIDARFIFFGNDDFEFENEEWEIEEIHQTRTGGLSPDTGPRN